MWYDGSVFENLWGNFYLKMAKLFWVGKLKILQILQLETVLTFKQKIFYVDLFTVDAPM